MGQVNCQFDFQGRNEQSPLTVGDRFTLACDGEMSAELKPTAQFEFQDANKKYTLHILEVQEATNRNFKLIVASYKPGEHTDTLKINDGEQSLITNELKWKVESVLQPNQKPQMVVSRGPYFIDYPSWLWFSIAGIVLAVAAIIVFIFYRRRRRQRLMQELEQFKTMLSPIGQFSKDIRKTVRELSSKKPIDAAGPQVVQLDRDFRLYLIRELMVPALQVTDTQLIREIKKSHRAIYEHYQSDFRRVLSELTKAKNDQDKVKVKDGEDLSFLTRKLAENIYDMRRKK